MGEHADLRHCDAVHYGHHALDVLQREFTDRVGKCLLHPRSGDRRLDSPGDSSLDCSSHDGVALAALAPSRD